MVHRITNTVGRNPEIGAIAQPRRELGSDAGDGTAFGVIWSYLSYAGARLIGFLSVIILARLLLPTDFGKVSLALIVVGYAEVIGNLGVNAALIVERRNPLRIANVVFIVSLVTGIGWLGLLQLLAPHAALFFDDPDVEPMLRTLAWLFPLSALSATHDGILQRNLQFRKRLMPELVRAGGKGISATILAVAGFGAWSLIWGQLIGAALATAALWWIVPWRPSWQFSFSEVRRTLTFGSQIVVASAIGAVNNHLDALFVGKLFGATALGFYTIAYKVPELFLNLIIWAVSKVTFPAYAKLNQDYDALRRSFLRTIRFMSFVTVPSGVGLALTSPDIVPLMLGANWGPSVPVAQVLAIAIALRSLGASTGDVFKALDRVDLIIKIGLVRTLVLVPSLYLGSRHGIVGVAFAVAAVTAAGTGFRLAVLSKVADLPIRHILRQYRPALINTSVMGSSVAALLFVLPDWGHAGSATVSVLTGVTTYSLSAWLFTRGTLRDAVQAVRGRKNRNPEGDVILPS